MRHLDLRANSFREILESVDENVNKEVIKEIKDKIRVYDTLAPLDDGDLYTIFDSGIFRNIVKGYIKILIDEYVEDEETADEILSAAEVIFDETGSREAEEYFG